MPRQPSKPRFFRVRVEFLVPADDSGDCRDASAKVFGGQYPPMSWTVAPGLVADGFQVGPARNIDACSMLLDGTVAGVHPNWSKS